jgi:predicted SAM-dependent methyltransferase
MAEREDEGTTGLRLHLGCGDVIHAGWVNIDLKPNPGVDRILDVREGLPYQDAEYIFAEHFIEHFTLREGLELLGECRRALAPRGVLRLTTPNLDWVWANSYGSRWRAESATRAQVEIAAWRHDLAAARDCLSLNRAFYGWGHRFLYNAAMLERALLQAGFERLEWARYGESRQPVLRGLERHERYPDSDALPHLLVVEASGIRAAGPDAELGSFLAEYERDTGVR